VIKPGILPKWSTFQTPELTSKYLTKVKRFS
jgi:hypothetical protein